MSLPSFISVLEVVHCHTMAGMASHRLPSNIPQVLTIPIRIEKWLWVSIGRDNRGLLGSANHAICKAQIEAHATHGEMQLEIAHPTHLTTADPATRYGPSKPRPKAGSEICLYR